MDLQTITSQVEALLALKHQENSRDQIAHTSEMFAGTVTLLSAVYGPESTQVQVLKDTAREFRNSQKFNYGHNMLLLCRAIEGALNNLKRELDAGLVGSLQKRLTSEVLTDLIQLSRAVLGESGDGAKNVAAVLTAAAFEDTIRRMGSTFAGLMGKNDLSDVIDALKQKGVLVSPQLGTAQSFLSFRNHALHANWDKIDRSEVSAALGFVQELILKHFQ